MNALYKLAFLLRINSICTRTNDARKGLLLATWFEVAYYTLAFCDAHKGGGWVSNVECPKKLKCLFPSCSINFSESHWRKRKPSSKILHQAHHVVGVGYRQDYTVLEYGAFVTVSFGSLYWAISMHNTCMTKFYCKLHLQNLPKGQTGPSYEI